MAEYVYCVFHHIKWEGKTLISICKTEEVANKQCFILNRDADDYFYYTVEPHILH